MNRKEREIVIRVFELMLSRQDTFKISLRVWTSHLVDKYYISGMDEYIVDKYILNNPPIVNRMRISGFYWKINKLEPRLDYIQKHLAYLKLPWYKRLFTKVKLDETS